MVKISGLNDLKTSAIPPAEKSYLQNYLMQLLSAYHCEDIQQFGCAYYLDHPEDIKHYLDMGLRQNLKDTPFEFCDVIPISDSHGNDTRLFHGCYIPNNDFAIDIFVPESVLDSETKKHFKENM